MSLHKKTGQMGRFFCGLVACSGRLERLDPRTYAAFMARGLVLVDQATRAHPIKHRFSSGECGLGGGGVTGFNRLDDFLDVRTQHRALRRVALVAHDGLLGALFGDRQRVRWAR